MLRIKLSTLFALFGLLVTIALSAPSAIAEKHVPHHRPGDIPTMTTRQIKTEVTESTKERITRSTTTNTMDIPTTPAEENVIVSTNNVSSTSYTTATEGFFPTGKSFPDSPVGRDVGARSIVWFGQNVTWNEITVIITFTGEISGTPQVSAENREEDKDLYGGWETTTTKIGNGVYSVTFANPADFPDFRIPHVYSGLFITGAGNEAWFDQEMHVKFYVAINSKTAYVSEASVGSDPSGVIWPDLGAEWLNNQLIPWTSQASQPPVVCLTQCQPIPPQVLNVPAKRIMLPLIQN